VRIGVPLYISGKDIGDAIWLSDTETAFFDVTGVTPGAGLSLTSIAPTGSVFSLSWTSRDGRLYNVKSTSDLSVEFSSWTPVQTNLTATPPTNTTSVTPSGPVQVYGVEEFPAP
jgi:hypothetical protein